ncbi:MAG: SLOG family protein [Rikenellaceae bacterium]
MRFLKSKTVAIIGSRALSTPSGKDDLNLENVIRAELSRVIHELYKQGKNTFLSGLCEGFELLCAEIILEFREKKPDVKLIAVTPHLGEQSIYNSIDRHRYEKIVEECDSQFLISDGVNSCIPYGKRNEYMVDKSSIVITYNTNKEDINTSLFEQGRASSSSVINICELLQKYFENNHPSKDILQSYSDSPSFSFDCNGLIFKGNLQQFEVKYNQINGIEKDGSFLKFYLNNSMFIYSSLVSDFYMLEYANSEIRN